MNIIGFIVVLGFIGYLMWSRSKLRAELEKTNQWLKTTENDCENMASARSQAWRDASDAKIVVQELYRDLLVANSAAEDNSELHNRLVEVIRREEGQKQVIGQLQQQCKAIGEERDANAGSVHMLTTEFQQREQQYQQYQMQLNEIVRQLGHKQLKLAELADDCHRLKVENFALNKEHKDVGTHLG